MKLILITKQYRINECTRGYSLCVVTNVTRSSLFIIVIVVGDISCISFAPSSDPDIVGCVAGLPGRWYKRYMLGEICGMLPCVLPFCLRCSYAYSVISRY